MLSDNVQEDRLGRGIGLDQKKRLERESTMLPVLQSSVWKMCDDDREKSQKL
jgi:hypothetical protein